MLSVQVNFRTILKNVATIKKHLKPGTKFCAVVKSNAYGFGLKRISKLLAPHVDCFAVATLKEAIELRENRITQDILLFGICEDINVAIKNDIITIDLSPQNGDTWGDYARTIIVENGKVVETNNVSNDEWKKGLLMEEYLHEEMCKFVTPETTFEQLYYHINGIIEENGYINLDFMGNLGHSIVRQKNDRVYIEKGNRICLGDVRYFTFEPHISVRGSKYGYKRENIYYFENGVIKEL